MDLGSVINSALVKAGLMGYASSAMHNPHLDAQVAALLGNVLLPKLPMAIQQQLMATLCLNARGRGAALIHWDPALELSQSGASLEYTGQDFLFNVSAGVFRTGVKIDRIVSVRKARRREHVAFPAAYPDMLHFAFARKGDADILLELPTNGIWNSEDLLVEAVPQFVFNDITSPVDIPANAASFIITALAHELSVIYGDRPAVTESLRMEMGANIRKAAQDQDDWTEPRMTMAQKMSRFGRF
jgi:hypothetical protein